MNINYSQQHREALIRAYEKNELAEKIAYGLSKIIQGMFYIFLGTFWFFYLGACANSYVQSEVLSGLCLLTNDLIGTVIFHLNSYASAPWISILGITRIGYGFVFMTSDEG